MRNFCVKNHKDKVTDDEKLCKKEKDNEEVWFEQRDDQQKLQSEAEVLEKLSDVSSDSGVKCIGE